MFYKILKKNTGLKYSVKEIPQNDYYKHLLILKLTYKVKIDLNIKTKINDTFFKLSNQLP